MTTTETARFARVGGRGYKKDLTDPLPPTLATLNPIAEPAARHRELTQKAAATRQARVDAGRELAEAEHADRERAVQAELEGRSTPSARSR